MVTWSLAHLYSREQSQSLQLILRIPSPKRSRTFDNELAVNLALSINFIL